MKFRNKKTGEIVGTYADRLYIAGNYYSSLAGLNEDWEDYEEPKGGYIIDTMEEDCVSADDSGFEESDVERAKELGIWFESKEEAKKAVEKLMAWKRLKDKGFKFESWFGGSKDISFWIDTEIDENIAKDLDLLFGGEE